MDHAARRPHPTPPQTPAAERGPAPARVAALAAQPAAVAHSRRVAAQGSAFEALAGSPRMVAQRQRLDAAFGAAVVQRQVVQSDWLRLSQGRQPQIETSPSPTGPFQICTDTTNGGYRDAGETALGSLQPLLVLSRWGVIPASPQPGANPFARAHLIAAEFGGQLKFAPGENIRFHSRSLEYGDWQYAENQLKEHGQRGFLTARSTESRGAQRLAAAIVATVAPTLPRGAAPALREALAKTLAAANFVPDTVVFDYTDVEGGKSFKHSWGDQDAALAPAGADAAHVYGALAELGLLDQLDIPIPQDLAAQAVPPTQVLGSRADLVDLLQRYPGASQKRRGLILNKLNQLAHTPINAEGFANQVKGLPEMSNQNFALRIDGDIKGWLVAQPLTADELQP